MDANSSRILDVFFPPGLQVAFGLFFTVNDIYLSSMLCQSHFKIAPVTSWLYYWVNIGEFLKLNAKFEKKLCDFDICSWVVFERKQSHSEILTFFTIYCI